MSSTLHWYEVVKSPHPRIKGETKHGGEARPRYGK
jgi:hypothetical protein